MTILERHVHDVRDVAAYWERERRFQEVEDRLGGFPAKRYYYLISGRDNTGTMAQEREWESFSAMETAYERLFNEPGINNLAESGPAIGNTERTEFYSVETPPTSEPGV
jgi:hypothetical protein